MAKCKIQRAAHGATEIKIKKNYHYHYNSGLYHNVHKKNYNDYMKILKIGFAVL